MRDGELPMAAQETHRIEFFGDDCPMCRRYFQEIVIGKCFRVDLVDYRVDDPDHAAIRSDYGVNVAPTVIVDGTVKIEGEPGASFVEEFGEYDDCRAALGILVKTAPPLPGAVRAGKTHPF
jgi:hypothetical protein